MLGLGSDASLSPLRKLVTLVAAALVVIGLSPVPRADAASGGTMAGTVLTTTGAPAAGLRVSFLSPEYNRWGGYTYVERGTAVTDSTGRYTSPLLDQGQWRVRFGSDAQRAYVTSWYGGSTPTDVALADTDALSHIDGTVQERASISGTVMSASGTPIAGMWVEARIWNPETNTWGYASADSSSSDAQGHYSIRGLDPGTYRIRASGDTNNAPAWWPAAITLATGDSIEVGQGATVTGRDFTLQRYEKVTGHLSGVPITYEWGTTNGEVSACPYSLSEAACRDASLYRSVGVGDDGSFELPLPPGSYRLKFDPWVTTRARQWWPGSSSRDGAEPFVVTAGSGRADGDGAFLTAGSVAGRAETAGGDPANGLTIDMYRYDSASDTWLYETSATTQYGTYKIPVQETGQYKLKFSDDLNRFTTHWYRSGGSMATADAITADLTDRTLDTIVVSGKPTISGRITNTQGEGVKASINACHRMWNGQWDCSIYSATTDAEGRYSMQVQSDDYALQISPMVNAPNGAPYPWIYYGGGQSLDDAELVSVGPRKDAVADATLVANTAVSCTFTSTGGASLPNNISVQATKYDPVSKQWGELKWISWAYYGGCQPYEGLAPGRYKIFVEPYQTTAVEARWYGDAVTREAATEVIATDGGRLDLSLQLPKTGAPTTQVTSAPPASRFWLGTTATVAFSSQEHGTTFTCTLNGVPQACQAPSAVLTNQKTGLNRFRVFATGVDGDQEATPVEKTWTVPLNDTALTNTKGWSRKTGTGCFRNTYSLATAKGSTLSRSLTKAREVALVATRGPGQGTADIYLGSTRLKSVNLNSPQWTKSVLIPVTTFATARTGTLKIVVTSSAKQVRVEGLGVKTF